MTRDVPSTAMPARPDGEIVFFFDIDNCLYSRELGIHEQMSVLIDKYFQKHLELSPEDALHLHQRYYRDYGLAIEGLVRHHKVDPLEYNKQVDDALPLDEIIKPNSALKQLLEDIDTPRVKLWLFTNAYITHGQRVVKLLGVDGLFDGMTYCDYGADRLLCKPTREMFAKAMREAGVTDPELCYFVDDSGLNIKAATELGWLTAHLVEATAKAPAEKAGDHQITSLEQLRDIFPDVFRR